MSKRILLVPVGSHGDVNPFVGLGAALKRRGHRVTVITNGYFEDLIRKEGLDFVELGSRDEFLRMVNHPDLWDPLRGFPLICREGILPSLRPMYKTVQEHGVPNETVIVGSVLAMGARLVHDKSNVPFVSVHLQPSVFRSAIQPPLYPGLGVLRHLPIPVVRGVYRAMDWAVDRLLAPEVNRFRAELNLPPVHRIMDTWWHSPDRVIGLFPEWFAKPAADWPPQTRLTGFPLYDASPTETLSPDLEDFLTSGPAPVVFTPGSAMSQGISFFRESVAACESLGCRGLLLTKFPASVPPHLPPAVRCFGYVPFSLLLPRAAAFVHHGGIGTTAQALAAGVPQLVMPFAHDQPDNADRVRSLGVALVIDPNRYQARRVVPLLRELTGNPEYRQKARELRGRFEGIQPLEEAAILLEEMGLKKREK